jgi:DNA-binding XRE family transcriptional regulator
VARQQQQNLLVLGQAVRELRARSNHSVPDLARICNVSPRRIVELEDGWLDPDLELIAAIARALDVRPSEIFIRAEQLAARDPAQKPGPQ